MAKPQRFKNNEFNQQLDEIIEALILLKHTTPEFEPTDVQVSDIAAKFAVNSATLRRWCQMYLGVSPRQYLAIYRVERAKHMLQTGMRPTQVWQQLAFTEHKVFSTLFKRVQGTSPKDYLTTLAQL